VLYKVEAVVRQFRALHVRSYLATTSANLFKDGRLKESIRNRSEIYDCRILAAEGIRSLARMNDADLTRKTLFGREAAS
jgi:hypothetical protein